MKHYLEELSSVFAKTESSENGLSSTTIEERTLKYGKNKLVEKKKDSFFKRLLAQLSDPMLIILLIAAALSAITAFYAGESLTDVFIILFVVIVNAALGMYQESKAEKAIEALKAMSAATSKVLRDGTLRHIKSEDLVVGDIIMLEAGDAVPADARLVESASLKIDEAALTGESVPVEKFIDKLTLDAEAKDISLGDRKNMVYMGSVVVYGRGRAVVTAIGMETEMGKIADAISNAVDNLTPLQKKLASLSKVLSFIVLGICAFMFVFSLLRADAITSAVIIKTLMLAISLAVAAIPEGLAAVVTVQLSIGVTKMAKHNAVIRKLTAVETLGCTQIICSDKTGTLTQNKMTVVDSYTKDETALSAALALCSDAELDANGEAIGEPTEAALVAHAAKLFTKDKLKKLMPRIGEAPFDSMRKMMSTVHKSSDGKIVQFTKGAPDVILGRCTQYLDSNGKILPLSDKEREAIMTDNKRMASKALRVLCGALKIHDCIPDSYKAEKLESELVFIGLVGMIDPIRPEVLDAIAECRNAGIRPVMITGDHRDTAAAIALELGIITDENQAITGAQLDEISDEQLAERITEFSVYARVQPEHKVRIVNAWKAHDCIVAMTGDGVNDAPSIKSADIGVGMGITGTDVTKNVADMVLADDNFATIVSAVGEGRRIYDNIRKAIQFLLSSNISEVLCIFAATVMGFTILQPAHILWINLITDTFPALSLGMEPAEKNVMHRPPRSSSDGVFSGGAGFDIAYQGVLISLITLGAYFIGHFMESGLWEITDSADGMTMAFLAMSMAEIFHAFNIRSQRQSIFSLKSSNLYLYGSMILSLLLTTAVIYVPFLRGAFGFEHISFAEYCVALGLAFLIIPIVELVKLLQRSFGKKKKSA
ncbi:MAG: cation-translocating P-type ATPase [Oscillospiraceae bacterium]